MILEKTNKQQQQQKAWIYFLNLFLDTAFSNVVFKQQNLAKLRCTAYSDVQH